MIEYVHTGRVTLQPRTLLGVMNAADYYGLEELKKACNGFVQQGCITVDTVKLSRNLSPNKFEYFVYLFSGLCIAFIC